MNSNSFYFPAFLLLMIVALTSSCNGQEKSPKERNRESIPISSERVSKLIKTENGVNCGFVDRDGYLWFGSNGGGIYQYDGTSFAHFSEVDGLCSNQVFAIIEDAEQHLWFGTSNGLCRYDRKTFTHIPIPFQDTSSAWLDKVYPVINPNAVHALALDKQGHMWIGTAGGGAYRYDGRNFTSYLSEIGRKQSDSLYHNWIPSITEDAEGNMWFASMTHGGASRYDGKSFTQFMPTDGLSDDMIRSIFLDRSGKLWFGFNGNRKSGLTSYDGQSFITYDTEDGLCDAQIRGMYEDKQGNLWLASQRNGICIYDGNTFREFTSKEGLGFEGALFVIGDTNDHIWFGGKNGLWRFDGETVTDMSQ